MEDVGRENVVVTATVVWMIEEPLVMSVVCWITLVNGEVFEVSGPELVVGGEEITEVTLPVVFSVTDPLVISEVISNSVVVA